LECRLASSLGSEILPDFFSILVVGDGALRVEILKMATFGIRSRIDDAVDECRLSRGEGVGDSLRKTAPPVADFELSSCTAWCLGKSIAFPIRWKLYVWCCITRQNLGCGKRKGGQAVIAEKKGYQLSTEEIIFLTT